MKAKSMLLAAVIGAAIFAISIESQAVYAQGATQASTDVGALIQAAAALTVAIGTAIGAIAVFLQGRGDHGKNVDRIAALSQKLEDVGREVQKHKDDVTILTDIGLRYNPAIAKYLEDNHIGIDELRKQIDQGTLDVGQLKAIIQGLIAEQTAVPDPKPPTT